MFTLWKHPEAFTIASSNAAIRIDRSTAEISSAKPPPSTGQSIAAIIGIIQLRVTKYLIVANTAKAVCDIFESKVYKLSGFQLLPFKAHSAPATIETEFLGLIRKHLASAPMYYSPTYDISTALQRQQPNSGEKPYESADERFFWNYAVSQPLVRAAEKEPAVKEFVCVTIFGVYHLEHTKINGVPLKFGIVSRRSRHRAGTRYFRRGIDDNGNVANYNETEQLLFVKDRVYSYVQTRGSVPGYWGEINKLTYRPKMAIGGPAIEAASKHFDQQKKLYGEQYLVNLVNQSGYEKAVKDLYENVVEGLHDPALHYVYFDFHHECSKMRWHRVNLLLDELERIGLDNQGWCLVENGQVKAKQSSVVRTNCMDCLDRTNVVQSCLGGWVLQQQLEESGVLSNGQKWEHEARFVSLFRNVWADNADGVSRAYSGTPALKTDFTRTGKRTKMGAMQDLRNSITRYYLNNLNDGHRQDAFNLFLEDYSPFEHVESPFTDRRDLWTRSLPYFLGFSVFLLVFSVIYPSPRHTIKFNFGVSCFFFAICSIAFRKVFSDGLQYVDWPKLLPLDYVRGVNKPSGLRYELTSRSSSKQD
ncbi:Phosphoinositide phosphatase SAC1 [Wickerhamiella sorbophila]|uniref:Phosphoinositide phosphatase SAC1 n=1 Tax=Wickerhamiella sorbophila TaxID=45607 RepID=A0A2T0FH65_9ASCO|nr:Phosphoinositide phosphatase SAC1 [Wickerhamiella sorbophila]PRT54279.1 Phosphoinositide phosphatase SAC1 [Wickerhamiella sorbophila]